MLGGDFPKSSGVAGPLARDEQLSGPGRYPGAGEVLEERPRPGR
jgi:hypothetical protein